MDFKMKLRGALGLIEKLSFFQFISATISLVFVNFPKELPLMENQYFLMLAFIIILSSFGILLSLAIRIKANNNEFFRKKYTLDQ